MTKFHEYAKDPATLETRTGVPAIPRPGQFMTPVVETLDGNDVTRRLPAIRLEAQQAPIIRQKTEQTQVIPTRKPPFIRRNCLMLAILLFLACIVTPAALAECASGPTPVIPVPTHVVPHPTTRPSEVPSVRRARPDFETGMVYPRWDHTAYGAQDIPWQRGLQDIQTKTGAQWIELPVLFTQPTNASLSITAISSTPGALLAGIQYAHSLGYHVFVIPLIDVNVPGDWSGTITPDNVAVWFAHY